MIRGIRGEYMDYLGLLYLSRSKQRGDDGRKGSVSVRIRKSGRRWMLRHTGCGTALEYL